MNPKGPALPFLDFFLSSVFGFCFGKILTFWGKRREREREREREEREREEEGGRDASFVREVTYKKSERSVGVFLREEQNLLDDF